MKLFTLKNIKKTCVVMWSITLPAFYFQEAHAQLLPENQIAEYYEYEFQFFNPDDLSVLQNDYDIIIKEQEGKYHNCYYDWGWTCNTDYVVPQFSNKFNWNNLILKWPA